MSGKPRWERASKYNWRDFLTEDERATLAQIERARQAWADINHLRRPIVARAMCRASDKQSRDRRWFK